MRTAFRALMAVQSLLLAALVVAAACASTPDLSRVPQAIAGAALALGLLSVLAIRTDALGARALYGALARSDLVRDGVKAHRPFQFAAVLSVLLVSAAKRLPAFLLETGPIVLARLDADLAEEGAVKTVWVWGIVTLLGSAALLLVLAFAALVIRSALTPSSEPAPAAHAVNTTVLWSFLAAGVLAAAEVPGLFTAEPAPLSSWQFWVSLAVSVALATRLAVLSLLFAHDHFALPLDATLASRALPVRIPTRITAVALVLVCAVHLVLERFVGVAFSAAAVVLASGPLARLLERAAPAPA